MFRPRHRQLCHRLLAEILPVFVTGLATILTSTAPVSATGSYIDSAVTAGTTPASASSSYIYAQSGRPSAHATCWLACSIAGGPISPANGTAAAMFCWTDQGWYNGNYNSDRWFIVYINGQPGQWWIHSSYIYYQTNVPHC